MKLSDAIRLGAMIRPQGFEACFTHDGRSCAMGAAYDAIGISTTGKVPQFQDSVFFELYLHLCDEGVRCPVCGIRQTRVSPFLIPHLNDDHRWTREQIADWLSTVEPADADESVTVAKEEAVAS